MKDPAVEYIDTIIDFFNQRAIVKSMFDKNDQSGVHIGLERLRKIQEQIIKETNDVFDLTTTELKWNLSDIATTRLSADRKTKHSKVGTATKYWNSNFVWYLLYICYLIKKKHTEEIKKTQLNVLLFVIILIVHNNVHVFTICSL